MTRDKYPVINFRVPGPLRELTQEFVERGLYLNLGDFLREATKEKIRKEGPDLYAKLFFANRGSRE